MFASGRPNFDDAELCEASSGSFETLVGSVRRLVGADPHADAKAMTNVLASWAIVHGLADLLIAGRLKPLQAMPAKAREAVLRDMIGRNIR